MYSFELHFLASAADDVIDALYEAGWDDAVVSFDPMVGGEGIAAFDREAPSAVHAVATAIEEAGSAGVRITGVSEDLVTLSEISERTGRSFSTVDHWATGRHSSGNFPRPKFARPRSSLYSWSEVSVWLRNHGLAELSAADLELAQVCEVADAIIRSRILQERLPVADRKTLVDVVAAVSTRLAFG